MADEDRAADADIADDDADIDLPLKYGWEAGDVEVSPGAGGESKASDGISDEAVARALRVIDEVERRLKDDDH